MKIEIIRDMAEMPPIADQWDALLAGDSAATIFQTKEWMSAWWNAYGVPGHLLLIFFSDGPELVGIAPLMRISVGRTEEIVFMGHGRADYLDLVARDKDRLRVARATMKALGSEAGWNVARLRNIPADSPTASQLEGASRDAGLWPMRDPDEICPALVQGGPDPNPEALLAKYRVRRAGNVLRRQGHFEIIELNDIREAKAELPGFFAQHTRRWQDTSTPSLFHDERNRRFFEEMVDRLLRKDHLLFTVARLNGVPIAYHFGFDFGGRVFWYKPSFDPEFARYSPGQSIIEHLVRYVVTQDRQELDFTIGAEPFKQRYANTERRNLNFRVYADRGRYFASQARDMTYRGLRWAARRTGLVSLARLLRR